MARYIDADEALKIIDNYTKTITDDGKVVAKAIRDVVEIICPEADVAEVKHGKWKIEESKEHFNVICSSCNKDFYVYKKGQYRIQCSNYCPNCGARMNGGTNNE